MSNSARVRVTSRVCQGLKDREVISAADRQPMAGETAFGLGLALIDLLGFSAS